jgi:hypothetical protein
MDAAERGFVRGPGLHLGFCAAFDLLLGGSEDLDVKEKEDRNCFGTAAVIALKP